jgi:hypothetical protein
MKQVIASLLLTICVAFLAAYSPAQDGMLAAGQQISKSATAHTINFVDALEDELGHAMSMPSQAIRASAQIQPKDFSLGSGRYSRPRRVATAHWHFGSHQS